MFLKLLGHLAFIGGVGTALAAIGLVVQFRDLLVAPKEAAKAMAMAILMAVLAVLLLWWSLTAP